MPRPRTRDGALAESLLQAAVAIVNRGEMITTRRVAEAAGTNIAALDQLFGGKAGLTRAIALDGFDQLAERFTSVSAAGDPAERLRMIGQAHRTFVRDHPRLFDLMVTMPIGQADVPRKGDLNGALTCRDLVVQAVGSLISGHEDGIDDAAIGFTAVLEGLAIKERHELLGSTQVDRDRIWESAVNFHLAGMALPRTVRTSRSR